MIFLSEISSLGTSKILRTFLRWTILVPLNAVFSFVVAIVELEPDPVDVAAMLAGIFTFIVLYTILDLWALSSNRTEFSKSLKIGAIIKMTFQIVPFIEGTTGWIALYMVFSLFGEVPFLGIYLTTIVDGLLLSIICLMCVYVAWRMRRFFEKIRDSVNLIKRVEELEEDKRDLMFLVSQISEKYAKANRRIGQLEARLQMSNTKKNISILQ